MEQSHLTKHQEVKEVEAEDGVHSPEESECSGLKELPCVPLLIGCFHPWPPMLGGHVSLTLWLLGDIPDLNSSSSFHQL